MSLEDRLKEDMKQALRAGDKPRLGCIRMLLAKLKDLQVSLRAQHGVDYVLSDEDAEQAVAAYAKQRRDSIASYESAGRRDLVDRERAELAIIEAYLPEQLGEDELRELVRQAIEETGASSPKELGKLMKQLMPRVKGRADGKQVNRIARELLEP
jgi:uncharacterized protein YqeY